VVTGPIGIGVLCYADRHVRVVAVTGRTGERATRFAAEFGCAAVVGGQDLLDRDDVYLPPPGLHAEWIRRVLECGRHVLTGKPARQSD
jgi:predicted dehydrogenase